MSQLLDMLKQLWSEGPLGQLTVISNGLAAAAGFALLTRSVRLPIDVEAFSGQIRKLVNSGNVDRALKLCAACGTRPQGYLVKAGLQARLHGNSAMVALQEAQPEALAAMQRGLVPAMGIGAMSGLCSAAMLAAHMQASFFPLTAGLALLGASVMAFAAHQWMRAARDVSRLVQLTGDL